MRRVQCGCARGVSMASATLVAALSAPRAHAYLPATALTQVREVFTAALVFVGVVVSGLCVSLYFNVWFGHQTYHNNRSAKRTLRHDLPEGSQRQDIQRTGSSSRTFSHVSKLPDMLKLNILEHLTAKELLSVMQLSRRYTTLCNTERLWSELALACVALRPPAALCMTLSDPPKDKASFFRFACSAYQLQVAEHMAQRSDNDAVYVCLHARLYNLTDFVWEHPGGDAIVREFHLRDASNTFESVLHSSHARSMMREFTILDLTHIIGGDGAPAFLLRTERSKDRWLYNYEQPRDNGPLCTLSGFSRNVLQQSRWNPLPYVWRAVHN